MSSPPKGVYRLPDTKSEEVKGVDYVSFFHTVRHDIGYRSRYTRRTIPIIGLYNVKTLLGEAYVQQWVGKTIDITL